MCSWVLVAARAWMRLCGCWKLGGGESVAVCCRAVCVFALCVVSCVWEAQRGWCMPSPAACTETLGETGEPRHHHVERAGAYTISALPLRRFNTLFEVDYFLTVFYSQRRSSSTSTLPYLLRPGWDMFGSSPELKEEAALPGLGLVA